VISGSMAPLFNIGETIRFRHKDHGLRPASLVVFENGKGLICHRLMWWKAPGVYYQKGDLHSHLDDVRIEQIFGYADALLIDDRVIPLHGPRFAFHNAMIWFLVALRDNVQYLERTLHLPLMHTSSRFLTGLIDRHTRWIRGGGGKP
jgi:hypothetical protein